MSHDIKRLGRNFLLSLGGEGLQSGFHFALNLILIRVLSVYDFGLFAIVFVLGGIALSYGNALVSIPATVHMPRLKSPGAVNYQDVVFSSIALVISAASSPLSSDSPPSPRSPSCCSVTRCTPLPSFAR